MSSLLRFTSSPNSTSSESGQQEMRGPAIATLLLLMLAWLAALGSCQMFQYSRGWRPGKRAEPQEVLALRCPSAVGAWEAAELVRACCPNVLDALEHCQSKEAD